MQLDYVDDRLHRWAKWAISGRPQLGDRDRTALYEMVKSGVIARGYGLKPEPEANEEEQTESAMQWLRDRQAKQYEVVVTHYIGRGTIKQMCRDLQMSESVYFKHLKLAKYGLEVWFEARAA